ncbi:DUF1489 family protein [Jhaorihella thermophila]|uniref:Lysophospholipase n=1 Tax=Jhaorihella thermophila TaxID=488547 RepID=A0A1H5VYK5_9RHOB|nr:DUF1489 domain-containing protein [Jhaorihella thermophila]SEF92108.1 hypothetical protein SAMN05421751_1073 [Jhaorihella thermophila]
MSARIHLVKLCVGADSVEDLADWQTQTRARGTDGMPRHVTRMWPKRESELLDGGSLYWVIRGEILCRQRILRLDEVIGSDGIRRCAIVLDPEIHRTQAAPRRPFQGWRYLKPEDAPRDLSRGRDSDDTLPEDLNRALAEIGVI